LADYQRRQCDDGIEILQQRCQTTRNSAWMNSYLFNIWTFCIIQFVVVVVVVVVLVVL